MNQYLQHIEIMVVRKRMDSRKLECPWAIGADRGAAVTTVEEMTVAVLAQRR